METLTEQQAINVLVQGMVRAWNAGSGTEFASYCEEDADFVNIYGAHANGQQAIAAGHDQIFRTVYAGSTLHFRVTQTRFLTDDIALVHVRARLVIPHGSMAGEKNAAPSMLMRRSGGEWKVAAFHNTLVSHPATVN